MYKFSADSENFDQLSNLTGLTDRGRFSRQVIIQTSNGLCEHCEHRVYFCAQQHWSNCRSNLSYEPRALSVENTDGKQRAFRRFSASLNLSFIKKILFALSNLVDTSITRQWAQSRSNKSQFKLTANLCLGWCFLMSNYFTWLHGSQRWASVSRCSRKSKAF